MDNKQTTVATPKKNTKACGWVCTLHNLTKTDEEYLADFKKIEGVKYFKGQREKGEETGKEHLQFFIDFDTARYFSTVQGLLPPTTHIEQRRAKKKIDAVNYVCKAETRIGEVLEFGEFIEERARTDISNMLDRIDNGADEYTIQNEFPSLYARHPQFYDKRRAAKIESEWKNKEREIEVFYFYGSTGVGKTYYVLNKYGYENVYVVDNYKNPFDGYNYEDVLLLDEFHSQISLPEILRLLDKYPMKLRCRYNDKRACFTKVYITSNEPLSKQFSKDQQENKKTFEALLRRIKNQINFDNKSEKEYFLIHSSPQPKHFQQMELVPLENDDDLPF